MTNMETEEIVNILRNRYPNATSLKLFINHHEWILEETNYSGNEDYSMKQLNGEWVKEIGGNHD